MTWLHPAAELVAALAAFSFEQGHGCSTMRVYRQLHRRCHEKLLRTPGVGAVAARLTSWRLFRRQSFRMFMPIRRQFDEQHYRSQWSLMLHHGGRRVLHNCRLHGERTRMGEQWTGPWNASPAVRVIWGVRPDSVYALAHRLCGRIPALHCIRWKTSATTPVEAPSRVAKRLTLNSAGRRVQRDFR